MYVSVCRCVDVPTHPYVKGCMYVPVFVLYVCMTQKSPANASDAIFIDFDMTLGFWDAGIRYLLFSFPGDLRFHGDLVKTGFCSVSLFRLESSYSWCPPYRNHMLMTWH